MKRPRHKGDVERVRRTKVLRWLTRALGDRGDVVTVQIDGDTYAVADIGMRMLTPRELFRAQAFGDDYQIDIVRPDGEPITKSDQTFLCGNSVCPPLAEAIVRANVHEAQQRSAA